jgi:hypothetical protein
MSYTCTVRCIILSLQQKRWSIIQTYIESQYYLRPKRKNLFPYPLSISHSDSLLVEYLCSLPATESGVRGE